MRETDLILMSLLVFMPAAFALSLMFFRKGMDEYVRWWTLIGTAVTFALSTIVFIDYLGMLETHFDGESGRPAAASSIYARADLAAKIANEEKPNTRDSKDMLSRYPWIPRFNIEYFLGVDGISMALVLLTTFLFFISMIASWNITKYVKGYCILFLFLETGVLGTFLALDFFLFYIFWEVMLLPMYFLIGIWGGPRREYAAIKFFLYTLLGSIFILIALLGFYFTDVRDFVDQRQVKQEAAEVAAKQHPELWNDGAKGRKQSTENDIAKVQAQNAALAKVEIHSFDLTVLTKVGKAALDVLNGRKDKVVNEGLIEAGDNAAMRNAALARLDQPFFQPGFQYTMFLLLFIGFAIKVPVFPFHTWLPDAHVEAPTPISMILAGILLKLGGYGILRIAYPICPWAAQELAWYLALFGIINIVYGAFAAMAQTDFKKLVAYSSVSHMGYVILGIAVWSASGSNQWSWGMNGAMYQMIAHGVSSAGMFFLVGVIYDRAHHRNLDNFRGLMEPMPLYSGISFIIFFSALGLPGLCGFVGEFMVVLSTWNYSHVFAVLAALTVVITAAYILWTMQRVYLGTNPAYKDFPDITLRELICIVPLLILAVGLGTVMVPWVLSWTEPHLTGLIDSLVAQAGR